MHSSAAVAGRALIMLACVVGIPIVALSGTSWSDMVKKLQDFRWPAVLGLASASTSTDGLASSGEATRLSIPGPPASPTAVGKVTPFAEPESPGPLGPMPTNMAALPMPTAPGVSPVMPVGYQEGQTASLLADNTSAAGLSDLGADPFHSIQDRLRQMGATYYLLESWGNDQQTYRFYCKMAVGGSAEFTRCFESTDADPLQAMLKVLRQVEKRRTGNEELGTRN
jgi:hypothetical protein